MAAAQGMSKYQKHVYWLTEDDEARLRRKLTKRDIKVKSAKGVVCSPLDEINKISSVMPHVWNETCARQGSWYRTSHKNGLYLVVSSFVLEDCRAKKAATITESDFVPPHLATKEEKDALLEAPHLKKRVPPEWHHISDTEKRIHLRWARRLGSKVEDYDSLHWCHTANHSNFIHPLLFIQDGGGIIPYSIDRSAHLCSCCVELYQVLGEDFPRKLVAPCPGATLFARLKPDRFFLVEKA
jgi:hypothetical protein